MDSVSEAGWRHPGVKAVCSATAIKEEGGGRYVRNPEQGEHVLAHAPNLWLSRDLP